MTSGGRSPVDDFRAEEDGLGRALELLVAHHHELGAPRGRGVELALPEDLPDQGMGGEEALRAVAGPVLAGAARLGHPGYFAHMDPPTPWMSWVGALWAAALNQNLLHPDSAPVARDLERLVVAWLAKPLGMRGGHLLPGSSVSNLTALWVARELEGVTRVVASELAHLSVPKAARILGLDYIPVPVDEHHRLMADALAEIELTQAAVVLTAGTVASGAIDPLDAGDGAAWRHVDAAWGGPLRFSPRYQNRLSGIERADSVSMSAHKLLFQPKECAAVLFADPDHAHEAITFGAGYLAAPNVGILGSHGASALPLAASLLAWGRDGLARLIDHTMSLAERLAEIVAKSDRLELWQYPTTGIVLWRPTSGDIADVHRRLEGAFVSLTDVGGEHWLRSVAANPNADPDLVVARVLSALASPA